MPDTTIARGQAEIETHAPVAIVGAGGLGQTIAWWLACGGQSPFATDRTVVMTVPESPRIPCDMTGPPSHAWQNLVQHSGARTQLVQATQILQTLPIAAAAQILAGDVFANASRTLLNRPTYDWPHALVVEAAPTSAPTPEGLKRSATAVLRDLMRATGGSAEMLADALGASRRSVYNWLKGKPVRAEFAMRAERLHLVLSPLRESWHPAALSDWLQAGEPPPMELGAQERWAELEERVQNAVRPVRPHPDAEEAAAVGTPESWSVDALRAVLDEFMSPPPAPPRTTAWRPRELTGSTPEPDEE